MRVGVQVFNRKTADGGVLAVKVLRRIKTDFLKAVLDIHISYHFIGVLAGFPAIDLNHVRIVPDIAYQFL